jgi:hypothetical protein
MRQHALRFAIAILVLAGAASAYGSGLSAGDVAGINKLVDAYVSAWLAGDEHAVMQLLTSDSVLIPAEKTPFVGSAAIHDYWWPAGASPF